MPLAMNELNDGHQNYALDNITLRGKSLRLGNSSHLFN